MTLERLAIIDAPSGGYVDDIALEQKILGSNAIVAKYLVDSSSRQHLLELHEKIVILWHHVPLDATFFKYNLAVRTVICASVGYDHVDIGAAAANGVEVYHVPHYGTEEVADHTLGLFLSLARRIPAVSRHVRNGGWHWRTSIGSPRLRNLTWGIIGLGRIGIAVGLRAHAFGMNISFYDPFNRVGIEKSLGFVRLDSLEKLLRSSDVVSLHLPLTNESRHILGASELSMMREGAYLINTARGGLIDTDALLQAVAAGRPAFVGLDVVEQEPCIPLSLLQHDRVLITPHSAFYSDCSLLELRTLAALAARDILLGQHMTHASLVTK